MNALIAGTRRLLALFFDDGFLAISTLVIVAIATVLLKTKAIAPLADGGILFGGCLAALVASVWRTARSARK